MQRKGNLNMKYKKYCILVHILIFKRCPMNHISININHVLFRCLENLMTHYLCLFCNIKVQRLPFSCFILLTSKYKLSCLRDSLCKLQQKILQSCNFSNKNRLIQHCRQTVKRSVTRINYLSCCFGQQDNYVLRKLYFL